MRGPGFKGRKGPGWGGCLLLPGKRGAAGHGRCPGGAIHRGLPRIQLLLLLLLLLLHRVVKIKTVGGRQAAAAGDGAVGMPTHRCPLPAGRRGSRSLVELLLLHLPLLLLLALHRLILLAQRLPLLISFQLLLQGYAAPRVALGLRFQILLQRHQHQLQARDLQEASNSSGD